MKRILTAILIAAASFGAITTAHAAKPDRVGTIILNESGPFGFQDVVTFTTTDNLKGKEYPMVYVVCYSTVNGHLLYGQLDYPAVAFVLGGGSSPWWNSSDDGECVGRLYSYGSPKADQNPYYLAQTTPFFVDK